MAYILCGLRVDLATKFVGSRCAEELVLRSENDPATLPVDAERVFTKTLLTLFSSLTDEVRR